MHAQHQWMGTDGFKFGPAQFTVKLYSSTGGLASLEDDIFHLLDIDSRFPDQVEDVGKHAGLVEMPDCQLQCSCSLRCPVDAVQDISRGKIVFHDPDGFRFTLLSHGGVASVAWAALDPSQQQELRENLGYVDVATDELMVDVDRLILVDGHEVVGVILSREGTDFVVQVEGNLQLVPKRRVQSISKGGQAPALDIYSREEL